MCLVCFFSIICIKPGCVFYRYTACFFDEKKVNYCKIQVSSLRRFAFATLRWPHCVRPPTLLRQPGSATRLITVLAPLPAHSGAQIPWPLQASIATFLDLRVNGFGRFCTLRHRYPPDGPPSLNVNLTLKSQEYYVWQSILVNFYNMTQTLRVIMSRSIILTRTCNT